VVVLCPTRDDFLPACCRSCVDQDYPADSFRVVVCDDSETPAFRDAVDRFCAPRPAVGCVRRPDRAGHKAGNLNHAFDSEAAGRCDWVLIVDADQLLPPNFLAELAPVLASRPPGVAFVQAGREPLPEVGPDGATNPFQQALQAEILLFSERDMASRTEYGLLPFLGHGGAVRESAWRQLGGFPPVVSEDYAFSLAARERGLWGERADHVRSAEGFPQDFGAFVVRVGKFAAGAGELWLNLPRFWVSGARATEKWDLLMLLGTYALAPLVLVNLVASAYLCHVLWSEALPVLPPRLPYLFLGMFLLSLAVLVSVAPSWGRAVRQRFWAQAVYGAALPVMAWRFVRSLGRRPGFQRTPKVAGTSPKLRLTGALVCASGLAGLAAAWAWWSPFSPILASAAGAQALFPVYQWLHEGGVRGWVSRRLVYLPGLAFLSGLVWMWSWATS
jgi:cellulose synthase/poly-beta-1,6-N-acetylglucosamine synthase-like glycosyltransferase